MFTHHLQGCSNLSIGYLFQNSANLIVLDSVETEQSFVGEIKQWHLSEIIGGNNEDSDYRIGILRLDLSIHNY